MNAFARSFLPVPSMQAFARVQTLVTRPAHIDEEVADAAADLFFQEIDGIHFEMEDPSTPLAGEVAVTAVLL